MGRPPRLQAPGEIFHVGAKGNRACRIFVDDYERHVFLTLLAKHAKRHDWILLAYVLMTNHYHLLLQLRSCSLSAGMCELNGEFSRFTSVRHGLEPGHLFGKRFWSELMESDAHFLATARYIELNPVRARICRSPAKWSWSSYRALAGLDFAPDFLASAELLKHFGRSPEAARREYRAFVQAGVVELERRTRDGARHRDGSRTQTGRRRAA
jgi:putative transposase